MHKHSLAVAFHFGASPLKMRTLFFYVLAFNFAGASAAEPPMNCNDQVVQYSAPQIAPLERNLSVKTLPQRPTSILQEKNPAFIPESQHGTAALNRIDISDTMTPGPYSNIIEVFSTRGNPIAWRLEIVNLKDNVRLQWLNEELLFIQAWWGRIVSTDLIFELSSGRFVYARGRLWITHPTM